MRRTFRTRVSCSVVIMVQRSGWGVQALLRLTVVIFFFSHITHALITSQALLCLSKNRLCLHLLGIPVGDNITDRMGKVLLNSSSIPVYTLCFEGARLIFTSFLKKFFFFFLGGGGGLFFLFLFLLFLFF